MSWIEDRARERGHRSLRAVAQAMAATAEWPDHAVGVESVANKLRDLNRSKDVDWWLGTGRPYQAALGVVLGVDAQAMLHHLRLTAEGLSAGSATSYAFPGFASLRPLDLANELPMPGVPSALIEDGGPKTERTWWTAKGGAGKTQVGRWLEVRHGWVYLQMESWLPSNIPHSGRVFVELGSAVGMAPDFHRSLPRSLRICVACPDALPRPSKSPAEARPSAEPGAAGTTAAEPSGTPLGFAQETTSIRDPSEFEEVHSPSFSEWSLRLVEWVGQRVRPGGRYRVADVERLLSDPATGLSFETPGDFLEFLCTVNDRGPELAAEHRTNEMRLEWAAGWLRSQIETVRARIPHAVAEQLSQEGVEPLVEMECVRIRRGWERSLPLERWRLLLPTPSPQHIDPERILALVGERGKGALDEIRSILAPDSHSIVRALAEVGALAAVEGDRHGIRPAWVQSAVRREAVRRLMVDVPEGLGAALLDPEGAEQVLEALIDDATRGAFDLHRRSLRTVPSTPEAMAAVDGCFRSLGLASLCGRDVPIELLRMAWQRQMALLVDSGHFGPKVPLVSMSTQDVSGELTSLEWWYAAALEIGRCLSEAGLKLEPSDLVPWDATRERVGALLSSQAMLQLDILVISSASGGTARFRQALSGLGKIGFELVRRDIGTAEVRTHLRMCIAHELVRHYASGSTVPPEWMSPEALHDRMTWSDFANACDHADRNVEADSKRYWKEIAVRAQGGWPRIMTKLADDPRGIEAWKQLPADVIDEDFVAQLDPYPDVLKHLPEDAWPAWLAAWVRTPHRARMGTAAFSIVPASVALSAVREGKVTFGDHAAWRGLWSRHADALLDLAEDLATLSNAVASAKGTSSGALELIVRTAPSETTASVVDAVDRWLSDDLRYPGLGPWIRGWLQDVVRMRLPGWRNAWRRVVAVSTDR